jgi:hypothetical protein
MSGVQLGLAKENHWHQVRIHRPFSTLLPNHAFTTLAGAARALRMKMSP